MFEKEVINPALSMSHVEIHASELMVATGAVGVHFLCCVSHDNLAALEKNADGIRDATESFRRLYGTITDVPSVEKTLTCWNMIVDICARFPVTTATVVEAAFRDIEAKSNETRVRYLVQRNQWLDHVLNTSGTGIDSWIETASEDESSLKNIEEALLFYGAVLKVLRKIEETIETKD